MDGGPLDRRGTAPMLVALDKVVAGVRVALLTQTAVLAT
jgi:hypothetical protein